LDCYRRCSAAGTGEHEEDCYCETCGAVADAIPGRCAECEALEHPKSDIGYRPSHLMGLRPQIMSDREAELETEVGPWTLVPSDSPAEHERRYRQQCSTMRLWTVYMAFRGSTSDSRKWKKLAVEDTKGAAVATLRRFAPKASYHEQWPDPPAMRFFAGGLTFFIAPSWVDVSRHLPP
jgi:hypothetical protein